MRPQGLRDGQQSLWAMGMRTGMMLPVTRKLDDAGFDAMEFVVPASQIKKMIRHLGEDFWQWVRLGTERMTRTLLRMTGGYRGSLTKTSEAAGRLLVSTMESTGCVTRACPAHGTTLTTCARRSRA